ncbi:acyltransferase family protein [Duncaniella muris]|uniref:acyltransferase family protein n=1 Tax=Duncaniella muris TaxID=2094150 RepID=UPI00272CD988|nr:acyltransferase [Duncaniella muris]
MNNSPDRALTEKGEGLTGCGAGSGRIQFVDTAKGICILLVVMYHAGLVDNDTPCLSMLRMPFYFTLSGLFFKDYGGFRTILKKVNKLLVPFVFFYTLSYLSFAAIRVMAGQEVEIPFFAFVTSKEMVNVALWFLLSLFWTNVCFFMIYKASANRYMAVLLSLAVGIGGMICFDHYAVRLPLFIDSGIAAVPFYCLGYMLKSTDILYPNRYDRYALPAAAVLVAAAVLCFFLGDRPYVSFRTLYIGENFLLYYVGAISVVIAFMLLCKTAGAVAGLRYVGRYSLIVLGVHVAVMSVASRGLEFFGMSPDDAYHSLAVFLLTAMLSIALIPVLKRLFPRFTAQRDLITDNMLRRLGSGRSETRSVEG